MNITKRFFCTTIFKPLATDTKQAVRVRYAPSPTGPLHIGGLRTALYNYLFAKKTNGKFILRIEDTDKTREVSNSIDNIIRGLSWAGLQWDEGPGSLEDTNYGPYYQSKRLHLYKKYAERLVENGDAYYCFCTPERLQNLRESQMKKKQATKYDGHCQHHSEEETFARIKAGEPYVIRLKVPRGETEVEDLIHGKIKFAHKDIDDQVLLKSDGFPTYHLANVIDDHFMEISHVIRGEEWLTSLPKHVLLYKALDFEIPQYAHLPLILSPTGGKLSKRHSHTTVDHYIEKDFMPEAVLNYVALLGWTPRALEDINIREFKDEIFHLKELEKMFLIERVVPSNSRLQESKLFYFNSFFMRKRYSNLEKDGEEKIKEFKSYLCKYLDHLKEKIEETSDEKMKEIMPFILDRIKIYEEMKEYAFFFEWPDFKSENSLKSKEKVQADSLQANKLLVEVYKMLDNIKDKDFNQVEISKICGEYLYKNKKTLKHEDLYHLLRYVVSGSHTGGPITKICEILGKEEILRRINPWL